MSKIITMTMGEHLGDRKETLSFYSKGFVVDSTFIDFISTKPIGMDEEKVKIFLAQVGKKLEELNKQHHTQQ